jgi:hypothetical protein
MANIDNKKPQKLFITLVLISLTLALRANHHLDVKTLDNVAPATSVPPNTFV